MILGFLSTHNSLVGPIRNFQTDFLNLIPKR